MGNQGKVLSNTNTELVTTARKVYGQLLRQRNGRVYWKHVKGHSGHIRNDHADHLATMGATLKVWDAVVPREAWRAVRGDGELLHNAGGWIGHNACITTTIEVTSGGWRVRQRADVLHECNGWVIRPGHAPWDVENVRATECSAVVRVERAARYDPFGVLNLMPYRHTTPASVLAVAAVRRREVRSCEGQV